MCTPRIYIYLYTQINANQKRNRYFRTSTNIGGDVYLHIISTSPKLKYIEYLSVLYFMYSDNKIDVVYCLAYRIWGGEHIIFDPITMITIYLYVIFFHTYTHDENILECKNDIVDGKDLFSAFRFHIHYIPYIRIWKYLCIGFAKFSKKFRWGIN